MPDPQELERPGCLLSIEGKEIPWPEDKISAKQIAETGGWDITEGVIEIDRLGNERTLDPDEEVDLGRNCSYGKLHKWKRGR